MTVGIVVVSHSALLAKGVVELAAQMGPGVPLLAAGGLPEGGLGTDFDAVTAALAGADHGDGVVVLYDLGSAGMVAEMAREAAADPDRVLVVDAPLVEGAVAAAVAAAGGADPAGVAAAARGTTEASQPKPDLQGPAERVELVLGNEIGLHARPAAQLARAVADLDAEVTVRLGDTTADARSVLALLGLAARGGDTIEITAMGLQAAEAIERVSRLAATNFGEAG